MKRLLGLIFTMACLISTSFAKAANRKVLMMVAEGFYATEYYVPLKIFEASGFQITTATKLKTPTSPDHRQRELFPAVKGDITFDEIKAEDYDAIVFAGGNGAWEDFFPNIDVHKALEDFMKQKKLVALICSATGLLGLANNLDGKGPPLAAGRKVTGYYRVSGILKTMGRVQYEPGTEGVPHVVVDENLITGRDPGSSELFGKTVAAKLLSVI